MTAHGTFLLLAARRFSGELSPGDDAALDDHLAACPECRSTTAGMLRDDVLLREALVGEEVAPHVRARVLDESVTASRIHGSLILGFAAILALTAIGVPFLAGAPTRPSPGPSPAVPSSAVAQASLEPSPSFTSAPPTPGSPSPSPSDLVAQPLATVGPRPTESRPKPKSPVPLAQPSFSFSPTGAYVFGDYTYEESPPRSGTLAAQFEDGEPAGEWTRRYPATGDAKFYRGFITCLVIDGAEAWLAGPSTTATDGSFPRVLIYVHDGGPGGENDEVVFWATTRNTLTTLEGWCRTRTLPTTPQPITAGDITVSASP